MSTDMQRIPISTQRKILGLEQQVFNLKQKLAKMKDKYEKQIAELKAPPPPILDEGRRKELIAQRERLLAEENARARKGDFKEP
jgi:hypothetical protein